MGELFYLTAVRISSIITTKGGLANIWHWKGKVVR